MVESLNTLCLVASVGSVIGTIAAMVGGWMFGAGLVSAGAENNEDAACALGGMICLGSLVVGVCWFIWGPFSVKWILGPFLTVGLLFLVGGAMATDAGAAAGGLMTSVACGIVYLIVYLAGGTATSEPDKVTDGPVARKAIPSPGAVPKVPHPTPSDPSKDLFSHFWPDRVVRSERGYLASAKFVPLRAIARRPNVPLFGSSKTEYPRGVTGVMKPWFPYYVYDKTERAMLVGETPRTKPDRRMWVRAAECFCWTTRECLNIEQATPIYATHEDAKAKRRPIDKAYAYRHRDHFAPRKENKVRAFEMAALPVLRRKDSVYWCFVRPEGSREGYQVCWLRWDNSSTDTECRVRTTRRELEEYLAGLRYLMIAWKNPEKRTEAKRGLYDHGGAHLTRAERFGGGALSRIKARREGIPKLTGYLAQPIESPLQYRKMSKDAIKLLRISSSVDIWDRDDVSYVPMNSLP